MPPFDKDLNAERLARLEKLMQEVLDELRQRPQQLPPGGLIPDCGCPPFGVCMNVACPRAARIR